MNGMDGEEILAAEWLKTLPGYRELLKQRIHTAQRRRMKLDSRLLGIYDHDPLAMWGKKGTRQSDTDKLGREVDGCG